MNRVFTILVAALLAFPALACQPGPGAQCAGANLKWADLENADLKLADLQSADLSASNLLNAAASVERESLPLTPQCNQRRITGFEV